MVIVESIVSAIVSILVSKGVQDIETKTDEKGNTQVFAQGKKIAKLEASLSKDVPLDFIKADIERITKTTATKPEVFDYEFENPFDKDVRLINLGLVGNANFYAKGLCEIKLNGILIFEIANGDLTDVSLSELPISQNGFKLKRNETLEVRVWSSDASSVSLTVFPVVAGYL